MGVAAACRNRAAINIISHLICLVKIFDEKFLMCAQKKNKSSFEGIKKMSHWMCTESEVSSLSEKWS